MNRIICLLVTLFTGLLLHAQHRVTFILKDQTSITHDSIYITGTFNNWDTLKDPAYLMKPFKKNEKIITLDLKAGTVRYGFHRGGWQSNEKKFSGDNMDDRVIMVHIDTTLSDSAMAWADEFLLEKYKELSRQNSDTGRLQVLTSLAVAYASTNTTQYNSDSILFYAQQALQLLQAMKLNGENKEWFRPGNSSTIYRLQEVMASVLHSLGNFPKALEIRLENVKLVENEKDKSYLAFAILGTLDDYDAMKDYQKTLQYSRQIDSLLTLTPDYKDDPGYQWLHREAIYRKAIAFYNLNRLDSALYYARKRAEIDLIVNDQTDIVFGNLLLADIYAGLNATDSAMDKYRFVNANTPGFAGYIRAKAQAGMAKIFQRTKNVDSALVFARLALAYFQNYKPEVKSWGQNPDLYISEISPLVAALYKANNQPDSAYKFLQLSIAIKDSLYNADKVRQFQTLSFNEITRRQQAEQQIREEKQRYETKLKIYGLGGIITGFVVLAFVLYRNNRHKQKANTLLQSQKEEIEKTFGELKNTQKQLIQSEKMASLGELTAGIAHEIQNPLNFVNNFSEVSNELMDEMSAEIDRGNLPDVKLLAADIKQNLEKINHHGKRADAIVKGMLQHSQKSNSEKALTDINALADEYLRLSYHGLRAKDKSFNATMKTDFGENVGKVNIIPQDIGRVLLNLYNNAFYAVTAKKKGIDKELPTLEKLATLYLPTVSVSTKKIADIIEIRVADNGNGIPQKIVDKIFQPFFTTKPTGQGTGLGLSLSYDIVKAHGGEIKVETKEGEGTVFIVNLKA